MKPRLLSMAWLCFALFFCLSNESHAEPTNAETTIRVNDPVHFVMADGSDVIVAPGNYQVEAADQWLRLILGERRDALLIQATQTHHSEEDIHAPVALTVPSDGDQYHIVFLLPNGKSWEAVGSYSGIRIRGIGRSKLSRPTLKKAFTARRPVVQLKKSSPVTKKPRTLVTPGTKAFGNKLPNMRLAGAPPPPLLTAPTVNHRVTNPLLHFRWRPGEGEPRPSRYKLCIAEKGVSCTPSTRTLLLETREAASASGTAEYELGVGRAPGSTASNQGSPITTTHYQLPLPIRFQGKRLQWRVAACATTTTQPALRGTNPERCTWSQSRTLNWPLPAPVLSTPRHRTALTTLRPTFKWNYGKLNGVDHFLVCLSKAGVACPTRPTATADTLVVREPIARNRSPRSYTPTNDLTRLQRGPLNWTVAACNAALGCTYQQSVRQLTLAQPSAPTLQNPSPNTVLGLTSYYSNGNPRPEHPVSFSWQAVPQVVSYKICLIAVNKRCQSPPGPRPESDGLMYRAANLQGTSVSLPLPKDFWWDYEGGMRFHWTVSACNAVGVCSTSPPRPIKFKVSRHSFSHLYPIFQNNKCTNCHGMASHNAKYQQHVNEGRFPAGTNPRNGSVCTQCHNSNAGFPSGWHAPPASLDFTGKSISETCTMIRHGATFTQRGMKNHLMTDELIMWAIRHLPGNPAQNITRWTSLLNNWLHRAKEYESDGNGRLRPKTVTCGTLPIGE